MTSPAPRPPSGSACLAEMGVSASAQALDMLLALLLGGALGLLYDMLRPPRHDFGGWAGVCLDGIFCAAAGFLLFSFAMSTGDGRLGTWVLLCALLGFLAYMHTVSALFLRVFSLSWEKLGAALRFCEKKLKIALDFSKFYFQKIKKCFIIKK